MRTYINIGLIIYVKLCKLALLLTTDRNTRGFFFLYSRQIQNKTEKKQMLAMENNHDDNVCKVGSVFLFKIVTF